jgi:hypothetical protein
MAAINMQSAVYLQKNRRKIPSNHFILIIYFHVILTLCDCNLVKDVVNSDP